jgi:predicted 2-oxoglutarate/Fe(II)-dependent dioxygenase YbiX
MIDLLRIDDLLDASARGRILAELREAAGGPATVLGPEAGGSVAPMVRRATRVAVSPETREEVTRRLMARRAEVEAHFGVAVERCEEPQFLRYLSGDFFVPHQDGNTPLVHDDSRFRRISAVVFLSAQSAEPEPGTYGGGSLVFHGPYTGPELRVPVAPAPGTMVAFRAETTHEVTPVTHGERYTIVSWYR